MRQADNSSFLTTADARKALKVDGMRYRNRRLSVRVPRRYFMLPDPSMPSRERQVSNPYAHGVARTPSYGAPSAVDNPAIHKLSVQYSPQDARSDLPNSVRQQQQEYAAASGSPEMRKAKKSSETKAEILGGGSPLDKDLERDATELDLVPEQPTSTAAAGTIAEDVSPQLGEVPEVRVASAIKRDSVVLVSASDTIGELDEIHEKAESKDTTSGRQKKVSNEAEKIVETVAAVDPPVPPQSSVTIGASPRVDSPTRSGEGVVKGKDAVDVIKPVDDVQPKDTGVHSRPREETISDDEQKNDLSFHSAQESQSDTGKHEQQGRLVPVVKGDEQESGLGTQEPLHSGAVGTVAELGAQKNESTELDSTASQQGQPKPMTAQVKPTAEAAKVHGAKQTQSLHPFAKPSKGQTKKERDAKKKEKKKGKEKVIVEKATPVTAIPDEAEVTKAELQPSQDTSGSSSKANVVADADINATAASVVEASNAADGALKDTKDGETVSIDGADIGQRSGKDARSPGKLVTVTQKPEVHQVSLAQTAKQEHPHDALSSAPARSCEDAVADAVADAAAGTAGPPTSKLDLMEPSELTHDAQEPAKKTKAARAKIAVPNLDLLQRKTSTSSTSSPLHTAFTTKTPSSGTPSPTEPAKDSRETDKKGELDEM